MKIALEKIRDESGNLKDIVQIPINSWSEISKAPTNNLGYTWVQRVNGEPVQAFTDREILVIEL